MGIRVTARHAEPTERLLLRFKRLCVRGGVFREIKRRRFHEKPSERKRRQAKETQRRIRKAERRLEQERKGRRRTA